MQINLSDDVHLELKKRANSNLRSMKNELIMIVRNSLTNGHNMTIKDNKEPIDSNIETNELLEPCTLFMENDNKNEN